MKKQYKIFKSNLPPKFRFTRVVFGVIMIAALFFSWGKYVVAVLGILFLISATFGYCITCQIYEKIWGCKECKIKK
ncbi:MAG: DUF4395 domain-containing protein [Nanoarchaeota archaeon]|nr:DUF4395 domain-containing protein [Nanoarchaeota archaeon]MBU1622583.1 DUF4395 domain-containing protein [Nanoarchaeota archaeon]MBU1974360.1 DUF4395 domain-containing protein [Nanoarchaeota archaeon]